MVLPKKEKKHSEKEAYVKISSWCAYQERSQQEVRNKLYEFGLKNDVIEEIIFQLIQENFLNEERFAKAFAGGKFRIKRWGRIKIIEGLKQKDVSKNCISIGLEEIPDEDYVATLVYLLEKNMEKFRGEKNTYVKKKKVADSVIRKGFEVDLVWDQLKNLKE